MHRGACLVAAVFPPLFSLLFSPGAVSSRTILVPGDYSSIQSAIVAASPGDTVLVGPGLYDENLDTQGKFLTLIGEAGAAATVVDGGRRGSVLRLTGGGTVQGFTLRNGQDQYTGGGILVAGYSPSRIRQNIIADNIAGYFVDSGAGGGIYIYVQTRGVVIEQNTIRDNYAGDSGGGIYDTAVPPANVIQDNVISGNGCHVGGGGARLGITIFVRNLLRENWSDSFGGGIDADAAEIRQNTLVGNFTGNFFLHGAGIQVLGGQVLNNIVVGSHGPPGLKSGAGILANCDPAAPTRIECNDSWNNDGGNFVLQETCDTTASHNFSADPLFCNPILGDFHISTFSPCAPDNNPACGLVGAFPASLCGIVPTKKRSWGELKVLYR
jgi:hypothetical protein